MSGECDKCSEHAVDCVCYAGESIPWQRVWLTNEQLDEMFPGKSAKIAMGKHDFPTSLRSTEYPNG